MLLTNYVKFFVVVLILQASVADAANRLLYENFDDQQIDTKLTTRIYGKWGLTEGVEYDLESVGYNGSGHCFSSTTQIPNNEAFLEWTSYGGRSGPPNPWPTNEWYVSFWVRYPTFTSTVSHENIKLFYPHWDGTGSSVGYDSTGHGSLYHAERSHKAYLTQSNWVSSPNLEDGNWHHVEFYLNAATGVHRMWYDGALNWESNHGPGAWTTPIAMYYFTFGSIDASGDSIFNRQFDEIEVWDGMPDSDPTPPQDNPPTAGITSPTSQENFTSDESAVNIAGGASDDNGISSISWTNNRGGQGTAYNDSGDWTSWSIPNISLQEGENVITVTATDSAGQTSSDSLTVTYNSSRTDLPPGDITDFTAQPGDGEIVLNWTNPTDSDFKGTLISYSTGNDPYPATHNDGTFVCDREAAPGSSDSFKVAGLVNGTKYNYSAFTYDEAGNYSETAHVSAMPNPSSGTVQAWSATYQSDDSTWDDSGVRWCARVLIEGNSITQSGNQVILGLQGRNSGDYRIRKVSIAEADPNGGEGDVVDNTWSEVTFNGNSAETWGTDVATVPSGTEKLSDPVYLSIEPGKDYYVTYLLESPSVYLIAPSDYRELYFDGIDHTEDIDWSANGHSAYGARLHAIASIYIVDGKVPPTIRFTADPAMLNNPGETTTFNVSATDPDGDSLTYTIDFGDGTASGSGSQVEHTYEAEGTYTAEVTVDDGNGNTVVKSLQITVDDVPPTKPTGVTAN